MKQVITFGKFRKSRILPQDLQVVAAWRFPGCAVVRRMVRGWEVERKRTALKPDGFVSSSRFILHLLTAQLWSHGPSWAFVFFSVK